MGRVKDLLIEQEELEAAEQAERDSLAIQELGDINSSDTTEQDNKSKKSKKKKSLKAAQANRTIEFYKIRRIDAIGKIESKYDIKSFIAIVDSYNFELPRLVLKQQDEVLHVWYKGELANPASKQKAYAFELAITREPTGMGQIVTDNNTGKVEFQGVPLSGESGYKSHFVIFEDGIAAFEYNQLGAKAGILEYYIETNLKQAGILKIRKCLSVDHKQNLKDSRITEINYTVNPTTMPLFNELIDGYELVRKEEMGDTSYGSVVVTTRAKRYQNLAIDAERIIDVLAKRSGKDGTELVKDIMDSMKNFVRFGGPNKQSVSRKAVNLFTKHITDLRIIDYKAPFKEHQVDPGKAFEAIIASYNFKIAELNNSVTFDEAYKK